MSARTSRLPATHVTSAGGRNGPDVPRIAVYTAVYGGYDRIREPVEQTIAADWICFTDTPFPSATWNVVVDLDDAEHPRVAVNRRKHLPHRYLEGYDWTIWIDGNMAVTSKHFVADAIDRSAGRGFTVFRHPDRDCVYAEGAANIRLGKADPELVRRQMDAYLEEGYPMANGLYACGLLVRDGRMDWVARLGEDWAAETSRWSFRDQLSLPVVAQRAGVELDTLPYHLHGHRGGRARLGCVRDRLIEARRLPGRQAARLATVLRDIAHESTPFRTADGSIRAYTNPWFKLHPHVVSKTAR